MGGGFCGIYLFSHLSTDVWELLSEQTVRNDRTSRLIESNSLHTVCLESRRLLIFFAAILSKFMFLVKQPSVVCRVLSSDFCPPHDVLHDIETYPLFYDSLYYPQYHLRVFSTAENFCSWLQSSLTSHRDLCPTCSPLFQNSDYVCRL